MSEMVERRNSATAHSAKPVMIGFFVPITSEILPESVAVRIMPMGSASRIVPANVRRTP